MKNRFIKILVASFLGVAALAIALGCEGLQSTSDSQSDTVEEKSEYLLSGFNSLDDLYVIKPIGILPTDTLKMDITEQTSFVFEGTGSLVYENIHGAYHEAFLLFENSNAPEINAQKISTVSVDVYNPNKNAVEFSLLMKTHDGATLFAEQAELMAQQWTSVSIDLTEYSFAQKEHIKGLSLRFDVDSPATFYVDNIVAKMGAEDLPPVNVSDVIDGLTAPEGVEKITKENFDSHVAFVEKTFYAQSLYNGLEDKTTVSSQQLAKLNACLAMVEDLGVLYDARKDFISRGYYGMNMTVLAAEDATYGGIWSVNVPRTNQQGVIHRAINVDGYGEVVYWLYNPMDVELTANFHGGWNSWDLKRVKLPAKTWTKVELNARWYEYDFRGQLFFVISGASVIEGEFKMTSIYGISAEVIAQPVIENIERLPSVSALTYEDKDAVMAVKAAYNDLSSSAKAAIANFEKLEDAEKKIYDLEAAPVIAMIDALPTAEDLTSADKEAVLAAKTAYEMLSNEAKALIFSEKITKLNACYTMLAAVIVEGKIALLPSVEEFEQLDSEKYIYLIRAAKAEYDDMAEVEKEKVSPASVEKLETLAAMIADYEVLFAAGKDTLTKDGNGSDWSGEITTTLDTTYGEIYLLDVQGQSSQNFDFHAKGMDTEGFDRVFFYVYNPSGKNYPMVAYTADWMTSKTVSLTAGEWTKVEIPVQDFYKKGGVFYVVVTGNDIVSGWKVSCFYGGMGEIQIPDEPDIPDNPNSPDEPESNVLLDASVAENLLSGRDTGNGGTVGTATDETYGNVWTIDVANGAQSDFHAKSLDIKEYKYITFYIYNPASVDVILVCYKVDWSHVSNTTMKANAWTAVSIETEKSGADIFFILNTNVTDGTWKVTSFIGADEPLADVETPDVPDSDKIPSAWKGWTKTSVSANPFGGDNANQSMGTDETYGDYIQVGDTSGAVYFYTPFITDRTNYNKLGVYVYNCGETDVSGYYNDWTAGSYNVNFTLKAGEWTLITFADHYITCGNNYLYISGTFKFTDVYGFKGEWVKATVGSHPFSGDNANQSTGTDATYGDYIEVSDTSGAVYFYTPWITDRTNYEKLGVYVYNCGETDVSGYYNDWTDGSYNVNFTLKAGEWTFITFADHYITCGNNYLYISGTFRFSAVYGYQAAATEE